MIRFSRATVLALVTLALVPASAAAVEYHDFFVGFSTEVLVSSDLSVEPVVPDSLTLEAISFAGTYGPGFAPLLRGRAGLGWFPRRPFRIFAGVEIPLVERLNRARARMIGVYFIGDVGMTLPLGWTANARLALQVPTTALGGLRIGVGVDRSANLIVSFDMATGAYPVRSGRSGS